jgi:hypothetical protein
MIPSTESKRSGKLEVQNVITSSFESPIAPWLWYPRFEDKFENCTLNIYYKWNVRFEVTYQLYADLHQ